jgi:hypothetical protein
MLEGKESICASSCPPGTSPMLVNSNNMVCSSQKSAPEPISIDASVYTVSHSSTGTQKIFYFVVNKLLKYPDVKVTYYSRERGSRVTASTLQQSQSPSSIYLTQFNNNSYIGIKT